MTGQLQVPAVIRPPAARWTSPPLSFFVHVSPVTGSVQVSFAASLDEAGFGSFAIPLLQGYRMKVLPPNEHDLR